MHLTLFGGVFAICNSRMSDKNVEKKFATNESYRHKGFRHNLLTEADLTIGSKGAEVESIQKKYLYKIL